MERGYSKSDIHRPLSRRQLLQGGLSLAAWAALGRSRALAAYAPSRTPRVPGAADGTRWALLSDTHIAPDPEDRHKGFCPYRNLQEVTAWIADHPPDGVVITGDLARLRGETNAYANVQALLAPLAQRPLYLGLGNHDNRNDFFRTFGYSPDGDGAVVNKHLVAAQPGPVRMIVLDSLLNVNGVAGRLGEPQRVWLQTILQLCDDRPTILFVHHPPSGELLDTRPLFEIIKPVGKIKAIVYGHSHKYEYAQVAGIHLINLPSTAYPLHGDQPLGWIEARLTERAGEFTLHTIGGNPQRDGQTQRLLWRA